MAITDDHAALLFAIGPVQDFIATARKGFEEAVNWGETRRPAETALAARKSLRAFGGVTWGAPVPKSQLNGQRESVIDESAFGKRASESHAERLRKSLGVDPSERLCGVGLLKRNGRHALTHEDSRGARVSSTFHVACWSLRCAGAESDDVADLKKVFQDSCKASPEKATLAVRSSEASSRAST